MPNAADASGRPLTRLRQAVRASVRVLGVPAPGETVVVALSGGPDSTALLHALALDAARGGYRVFAAHLDHQLRVSSKGDADFCARLCRSLAVPLRTGTADVRGRRSVDHGGLEEAARIERHAFLERVRAAEGAAVIALGHTRDDQAETVLMRLLRGAGSSGLAAMRPRAGRLVRPILGVGREDVIQHLQAHGLEWRIDPTNADVDLVRNRIRHELIPYLEGRFNPAIRATLARTASVMAEEADVLAALAGGQDRPAAALSRAALLAQPRALARLAVRAAIAVAGSTRGVRLEHVDRILALAAKPSPSGHRLPLPGGREAAFHFDEIRIGPAAAAAPVPFAHPLAIPGRVELPGGGVLVARRPRRPAPSVALPDVPLTVRSRRPGDRVTAGGRETSLKRFLADRRVPAAERDRIAVVASGERVLWIAGHEVDPPADAARRVRLDLVPAAAPAAGRNRP